MLVPRGWDLWIILPDLHIPAHHVRALNCVMSVLKDLKPYGALILGDWLDVDALKKHPPRCLEDTLPIDYQLDEIDPCNELLDTIEDHTKKQVYIEGNHCHRVTTWCARQGRAGVSINRLLSPKHLLSDHRKTMTWVPYNMGQESIYWLANDLMAIHGWFAGKYAAGRHLSEAQGYSIVFGHTHRKQMATTKRLKDRKPVMAWSPGCLRNVDASFVRNKPNDWVHGFSLIAIKRDKSAWYMVADPMIDHKFEALVGGKVYKG